MYVGGSIYIGFAPLTGLPRLLGEGTGFAGGGG